MSSGTFKSVTNKLLYIRRAIKPKQAPNLIEYICISKLKWMMSTPQQKIKMFYSNLKHILAIYLWSSILTQIVNPVKVMEFSQLEYFHLGILFSSK